VRAIEPGSAQATFSGSSSNIEYSFLPVSHSTAEFISISFGFRSRSVNATIIKLQQLVAELVLIVELSDGAVSLSNNSDGVSWLARSSALANDGLWHSVFINVSSATISISVDGSVVGFSSMVSAESISQLFNSTFSVVVGRASSPAINSIFKGCLDGIRINDYLLPFANYLTNVTDGNHFVINSTNGVDIGCHGDSVCDLSTCANSGTCVDLWNAFACQCAVGYNGTLCQLNIEDCVTGSECLNGGTCIDGIASYSCRCAAGFTGTRYVPIASNYIL